jgi:CelD/BcsL family acetyltransferase involved in cellulose biosynthesis
MDASQSALITGALRKSCSRTVVGLFLAPEFEARRPRRASLSSIGDQHDARVAGNLKSVRRSDHRKRRRRQMQMMGKGGKLDLVCAADAIAVEREGSGRAVVDNVIGAVMCTGA